MRKNMRRFNGSRMRFVAVFDRYGFKTDYMLAFPTKIEFLFNDESVLNSNLAPLPNTPYNMEKEKA